MKGKKRFFLVIVLTLFACIMFNIGTSKNVEAEKDQVGFEVGKTWGQNLEELEKSYKKSATTEKKTVKKGAVELKIKNFPLSHYEAVANTGSISPYNGSLLAISNGIFSLNKFLVQGFDTGIEYLQGMDFLNTQINTVGRYVRQIWHALIDNLLPLIVAIFGFTLASIIYLKFDVLGAIKYAAAFVGVFILATVFIGNGVEIIQTVNDASLSVEETILGAGTDLVGNVELKKGESTKDTTASIMRNQIFDVGIYRPYLLMNYGTTNVAEIEGGQDSVDNLLKFNQTVTGIGKKKDQVVKEAKENTFMDKEGVGIYPKIGYALFSVVCTVGVGIPLLIISSLSLLSQILVVTLFFILVLSFFISFIPKFQDSWFKPLMGLMGAIFLKGLAAFLIMLVYVIMQTVNNAIPPTSAGKYASNVILLIILLNWMVKNRSTIVSMLINRQPMQLGNAISGRAIVRGGSQAVRAGRNTNQGMLRTVTALKGLIGGNVNPTKEKGSNEKVPSNQKPSQSRNPLSKKGQVKGIDSNGKKGTSSKRQANPNGTKSKDGTAKKSVGVNSQPSGKEGKKHSPTKAMTNPETAQQPSKNRNGKEKAQHQPKTVNEKMVEKSPSRTQFRVPKEPEKVKEPVRKQQPPTKQKPSESRK